MWSFRSPLRNSIHGIACCSAQVRSCFLKASVSWPNNAGEAMVCRQARTRKSITPPELCSRGTHVSVEIQAVDAAHFQRHVVFDNLGNVGHGTSSRVAPEEISPNDRPRRALALARTFFFSHTAQRTAAKRQ